MPFDRTIPDRGDPTFRIEIQLAFAQAALFEVGGKANLFLVNAGVFSGLITPVGSWFTELHGGP